MALSTHVLDVTRGVPAAGIDVALHRLYGDARVPLALGITDADGRIAAPFGGELVEGIYELTFAVGAYAKRNGIASFYDEIPVRFVITDAARHHHVPLLLSPWGYTTYRGS